MATIIPLLLAGVGAAVVLKGKKRKPGSAVVFDDDVVVGGDPLPPVGFNEVGLSPDLTKLEIGGGWKLKTLDQWLNKRRLAGKIAMMDHGEGILYDTLVNDPAAWLGDITGFGKNAGAVMYGSLWLMATAGLGIYASGFARASANIGAATQAANGTRAMQVLGPRATKLAGQLYKKGFSSSQIGLALKDFGGMDSLTRLGVGKAIAGFSGGAAGLGVSMTAAVLAEIGVNAAFSEDMAASAVDAAATFTIDHTATVAGEQIPIAILPATSPAVQELNKFIMAYIIRFQKMHFED